MTSTIADFFGTDWPTPRSGQTAPEFLAARKLALSAERVLNVSRAFAEAGRPVDLTGLHLQIGRLTAAILDLELPDSRALRPDLHILLDSLNRLERAVIATAPDQGMAS